MAMGARRGRPIAAALVAGMLAAVAGAVVLVFQPAGAQGPAALLFLAGLAVGALLATRLPAPRATRTVMERLNDVAFAAVLADRKSTRLNSSHVKISYAVFGLKKKKKK